MLSINGTNISITRGDSAYLSLKIKNADGTPYCIHDGDVIRCQVRTKVNSSDSSTLVFEGFIEQGKVPTWHIRPEDTRDLPIKEYIYDAQIETENGDVFTFIPASKFILMNEVTV